AASIEAKAFIGLLDATAGSAEKGRAEAEAALKQARLIRDYALEGRCTVILARIAALLHRETQAAELLNGIEADTEERSLGPELQAEVKFLRSRLTAGRNEDLADAKRLVQQIVDGLPEEFRERFKSRADIRAIAE